jgi:hypothetical protein
MRSQEAERERGYFIWQLDGAGALGICCVLFHVRQIYCRGPFSYERQNIFDAYLFPMAYGARSSVARIRPCFTAVVGDALSQR